MKAMVSALAMAAALVATETSAQDMILTGNYRCVQLCADGLVGTSTSVGQNGWDLNFVTETGQFVHGWMDRPGHIWIERWNQGAIYDGRTIWFERGAVWERDFGQFDAVNVAPAAPRPAVRGRRVVTPAAPAPRPALSNNAFDGSWSVVIVTNDGPCDRAYRYGVQINNGYVSSESGVSLQGRVAPNGSVRVSVAAGGNFAEGQGRMSQTYGTGTWHGQGGGLACAGTWQAERRG